MKERVQKLLAQANLGSRRACENLIRDGRVRVNGRIIQLGDQADPQADIIEVDGERLKLPDRLVYFAFNKPRNVLSTDAPHKDDARRTVRAFLPYDGHLFTVGRLDAESEGLMVLTNDGDLANRLSHPRYRHTKTYKVVVYGLPSAEAITRWQEGIELEDEGRTAPCWVKIIDGGKETTLRIVMTEGKKRQIRRVAALLGYPVKSLVRTHIGRLGLGSLRPGEWRELTPQDLEALRAPAAESLAPRPDARRQRGTERASINDSPHPRRPAGDHRSGSGSRQSPTRRPPANPRRTRALRRKKPS